MIGCPSASTAGWVVGGRLRVGRGWVRRRRHRSTRCAKAVIDRSKLRQTGRITLWVSSVALTDLAQVALYSRSPVTGEHPRNKVIVSPESIRRAAEIVQTIEQLQAELTGLFGGAPAAAPKRRGRPPGVRSAQPGQSDQPKTRNMSPEGRARIAAAAKARWARVRAEKAKAAKKAA